MNQSPAIQAEPPRRGFGNLCCPRCGQAACIQLDLDDLDLCTCRECSDEFAVGLIRDLIASWAPVLAWIDQAPKQED